MYNLTRAGRFPVFEEMRMEKIDKAIEIGFSYGQIDGAHHKQWVIDQMLRVLCGDKYDEKVTESKRGEDGPETYSYDVGVAP